MQSVVRRLSLNVGSFVFLSAALMGCKEDVVIENGELPAEYVAVAKAYTGRYNGRFDDNKASFAFGLNGAKPTLQYNDIRGRDVLHPSCGSRIGILQSLNIKKKANGSFVHRATFEFDPGRCSSEVEGRTLTVKFTATKSGVKRATVRVLESARETWVCDEGDATAEESCRWEVKQEYRSGEFELAK